MRRWKKTVSPGRFDNAHYSRQTQVIARIVGVSESKKPATTGEAIPTMDSTEVDTGQ